MIPESFDYQRAGSVREALTLLKQHGENAKVLAGGHSLIPTMKLRLADPETLIDIGGISELKYINDKGDYLAIGAGTTHLMVETSSLVQQKAPALSQAAGQIGDVQVRNRGTIGGVLAHSDPQADYPGVVLALNATIVAEGSGGERGLPALRADVQELPGHGYKQACRCPASSAGGGRRAHWWRRCHAS